MVLGTLAALSVGIAASSQSYAEAGRDSAAMLAHWKCANWAEMTGDTSEVERHFNAGLEVGRRFVQAARDGLISADQWNGEIPVGIAMTTNGPTNDFILGRLFALAGDEAYDDIAKRDEAGLPLSPQNYVTDSDIATLKAAHLSRLSNCSVL